MDRKLQKEEAINRLNLFKDNHGNNLVMKDVYNGLGVTKRTLYVSERMSKDFPAVLYWAKNYEGLMDKVEDFEKEYNAYVYHVILTHTTFGDMYAMLYVSDEKEYWEEEREDLKEGYAYANVWTPDIGVEEIGEIGVKASMGGIERTA